MIKKKLNHIFLDTINLTVKMTLTQQSLSLLDLKSVPLMKILFQWLAISESTRVVSLKKKIYLLFGIT